MNERYRKVGDAGALLAADADEWVAVLDTRTNLMWAVEVAKRQTFKKAQASMTKLSIAGFRDWRLPTVEELFLLADHTRKDPAIDTDFFPDTPSDWFWSSTVYAGPPADYAWIVYFVSGNSGWSGQSLGGYVRAVRAGQ